jgi:hypothetical protein
MVALHSNESQSSLMVFQPGASAAVPPGPLGAPGCDELDLLDRSPSPAQAGFSGVGTSSSAAQAESLIPIEEVQRALNRSRASVYRYTNTDPRNLNPPFNSRKLNPEYRSDQKDPLLFHPNEVARFARDVLRIKEVTVEVLNSPSSATQQLLASILEELRAIRLRLEAQDTSPSDLDAQRHLHNQSRPAA